MEYRRYSIHVLFGVLQAIEHDLAGRKQAGVDTGRADTAGYLQFHRVDLVFAQRVLHGAFTALIRPQQREVDLCTVGVTGDPQGDGCVRDPILGEQVRTMGDQDVVLLIADLRSGCRHIRCTAQQRFDADEDDAAVGAVADVQGAVV